MSTVRVSIDLPLTRRAPWATRRVLRSDLEVGGWGSATSELEAGPAVSDVATSAVEHSAAVRRIVGDRDHRHPRRPRHPPLEVVADEYAVEHNDVDHNLARSGVADRVVPAADRSREDGLSASGGADRVSNSSYRR